MERLGITVGFDRGPLEQSVELARRAEELGYTDAWTAEVSGADGVSPLVAAARHTSRIRLGTAILPAYTRSPALIAMTAAAAAELSGGRFVLGLGTSSRIIVERWMGGRFESPLLRLRETVEVVRAALSGEKLSYRGSTVSVEGFRLGLKPPPVPVYLAALGRRACELAGEIANGVIFFLKSPEGVRQALGWVAEGARRAGRDPAAIDCVARLPVFCAQDPEAVRSAARRLVLSYALVDVYARSLDDQGFGEEVRGAARAWASGDREGAARALSERLIDELVIAGDGPACARRIQDWRQAGVTTPVLMPLSSDPAGSAQAAAATLEALAPRPNA